MNKSPHGEDAAFFRNQFRGTSATRPVNDPGIYVPSQNQKNVPSREIQESGFAGKAKISGNFQKNLQISLFREKHNLLGCPP